VTQPFLAVRPDKFKYPTSPLYGKVAIPQHKPTYRDRSGIEHLCHRRLGDQTDCRTLTVCRNRAEECCRLPGYISCRLCFRDDQRPGFH
jgi:hypothetical protein